MAQKNRNELSLVYSCSGCSNIARLANQIAVELDRDHMAEMSCIAGAGGNVESTYQYTLTEYGIKKKYHMGFSHSDVSVVKNKVIDDINKTLHA